MQDINELSDKELLHAANAVINQFGGLHVGKKFGVLIAVEVGYDRHVFQWASREMVERVQTMLEQDPGRTTIFGMLGKDQSYTAYRKVKDLK